MPNAAAIAALRVVEAGLHAMTAATMRRAAARADLVRALAQDIERAAAATTPDVSVDERLRELERQNLRNRARGRTSKPY
ncbi:MAG: hypothetical protein ACLP19_13780 [Xanthobacteraceae bacterium]